MYSIRLRILPAARRRTKCTNQFYYPRPACRRHARCLLATTEEAYPTRTTSHGRCRRFFFSSPTIPLRCSSSPTRSDDDDLKAFTNYILDTRKKHLKLGTLTDEQWDHCLRAMLQWLNPPEEEDKNSNARQRRKWRLSGYSVDAVDRLLHRLLYEYAATAVTTTTTTTSRSSDNTPSNVRRRKQQQELQEWMVAVLQAWLQVSHQFPDSLIAVQRAQRILDKILDWQDGGLWCGLSQPDKDILQQEQSSSSSSLLAVAAVCIGVIQAWIRLETTQGTERAIEMLVSPQYLPFLEMDKENSIRIYHQALKQALEDNHLNNDSALKLSDCMNTLIQQDPDGWDGIQLDADEDGMILGNRLLFVDDDDVDDSGKRTPQNKSLSSFEQSALQKQLLHVVDQAKYEDRDTVEELIQKWTRSGTEASPNFASKLYTSLTRYYTHSIKDPRAATSWLLKLENIIMQSSTTKDNQVECALDVRLQLYQDLIDLWGSRSDSEREAPWRADELLRRLEAMTGSKGNDEKLSDSLYSKIADLWISSRDANASRKLLELCNRAPAGGTTLLRTTLPSLLLGEKLMVSDDNISKMLESLSNHWTALEKEDQMNVAVNMAESMCRHKLSTSAMKLATSLAENHITPSSAVCENLAGSFSDTSYPNHVLGLLDVFEGSQAKLTFGCYKAAINSLLRIRHKPKFQAIKRVLKVLLTDITEQGLDVDMKELGSLLVQIMHALTVVQRYNDALAFLRLAEDKLLSLEKLSSNAFPVPLNCYREVAIVSFVKGKTEMVEEIFERVLGFCQSGHKDMNPDSLFYNLYMVSLAKQGPGTVHKRIELLHQLIKFYEISGEESHKPLGCMFISIIRTLAATPSLANAEQAVSLVNEMTRLGVDVQSAFGLNTVMHLVLQSGMSNALEVVMNILAQFEKLQVEPDAYTLHNVLKACASVELTERRDIDSVMRIALKTLSDIREKGWTHEATYLSLFQVLRKANGHIEEDAFVSLFNFCCEDGLLSRKVREDLRELANLELWFKLYDLRLVDGLHEPEGWSRNVNKNLRAA